MRGGKQRRPAAVSGAGRARSVSLGRGRKGRCLTQQPQQRAQQRGAHGTARQRGRVEDGVDEEQARHPQRDLQPGPQPRAQPQLGQPRRARGRHALRGGAGGPPLPPLEERRGRERRKGGLKGGREGGREPLPPRASHPARPALPRRRLHDPARARGSTARRPGGGAAPRGRMRSAAPGTAGADWAGRKRGAAGGRP